MRFIITEDQNKNLKILLKQIIKSKGIDLAFSSVNGFDNFVNIMDVDSPRDFLDLFNDLDQVQSEEYPNFTLFRYKPKHNFMIYDKKNDNVYINYDEIWEVLMNVFNLEVFEIQELIKEWLFEVYNLRGVTPERWYYINDFELFEVYNLRGVTPTSAFSNESTVV